MKEKNNIRILPKYILGFVENQEKATLGLGNKLVLTKNDDNAVLKKADATIVGEIKINSFEWCVPHYIGSISQQAIFSKQILSKIPAELQYVERSVFMKEVKTQIFWTFKSGLKKD